MNFFRDLSTGTSFPICYNLLPHFARENQPHEELINCVNESLQDGRIRAFLLADRPDQPQNFSTPQLARDIITAGGDPIVTLALNYHDRNHLIARLQEYRLGGVQHFLIVSGNQPPKASEKPVFDLDSVQMLMLLAKLPERTNIVTGCVVSPFKTFESEQIWQYEKLKRKVSVGADFIVSQLGYDIRKYDELVRYCTLQEVTAPLVANISITGMATAEQIQSRTMPGVKMPEALLRALHDRTFGPSEIFERTAMTLAVLRGLGYQGGLLSSHTPVYSEIKTVLDRSEALRGNWQEFLKPLDFSGSKSRFYYFKKDSENGLNTNETEPVALKHFPSLTYTLSYFVDWLVYVPKGPLFKLVGRFCHFCSRTKFWYGFLWLLEYFSKRPLYGCNMCGDCTLYACGFLCYQSGCPKKMVNGPCGGSIDGYCEFFPERNRCFWVRVYHHMKGVRQHVTFVAPPIPARNTSLKRTSSWINFFLGRDHRCMKFKYK
jgi:methylenetetrahydrofolate reductase (NADPH)